MKKISNTLRIIVIAISLFFTEAAIASKTAGDIKVPFGIRYYDIGIAQNFNLQDVDGENFELNNTKGHWVFLHF